MKIRILGCGWSGGVPLSNGNWGGVNPLNEKNARTRSSVIVELQEPLFNEEDEQGPLELLENQEKKPDQDEKAKEVWLIDPGPDLRFQLLRHQVREIHGVLLTHAHEDHVGGIPDLSSFAYTAKKPIYVYGNQETLKAVSAMFEYCIVSNENESFGKNFSPTRFIVLKSLEDFRGKSLKTAKDLISSVNRPDYLKKTTLLFKAQENFLPLSENFFYIGKIPVYFFEQPHGSMKSLGFRFPSWAYSTDLSHMTEEIFRHVQGLDLWIVACTYFYTVSSNHGNFKNVLEWISSVSPKKSVLTHMSFEMDYDELLKCLPKNLEPGFDDMVLEV